MRVAFQMDPIGPIDINADSTFRLAEEAQEPRRRVAVGAVEAEHRRR